MSKVAKGQIWTNGSRAYKILKVNGVDVMVLSDYGFVTHMRLDYLESNFRPA